MLCVVSSSGSLSFTQWRGLVVLGVMKAHLTPAVRAMRRTSWLNPLTKGFSAVATPRSDSCSFRSGILRRLFGVDVGVEWYNVTGDQGHACEFAFVNVIKSLKEIAGVVDVGRDMFQKRFEDLLEKPAFERSHIYQKITSSANYLRTPRRWCRHCYNWHWTSEHKTYILKRTTSNNQIWDGTPWQQWLLTNTCHKTEHWSRRQHSPQTLYTKPASKGITLIFNSQYPSSVKRAVVANEIKLAQLCASAEDRAETIQATRTKQHAITTH